MKKCSYCGVECQVLDEIDRPHKILFAIFQGDTLLIPTIADSPETSWKHFQHVYAPIPNMHNDLKCKTVKLVYDIF